MTHDRFDLVVIGAGAGGLTAAKFAAKLGARVALVERGRLGGDCTWTGCIPSKSLIRVAQVAHDLRSAERFGLEIGPLTINADRLRGYVQGVVRQVADAEPAEALGGLGIDVRFGAPAFQDPHTLRVDGRALSARSFLITTGAHPVVPPISGLGDVPHVTYQQIFDLDRVPESLVVIGGGPLGVEIAQAYQRLGSHVSIVARRLLPRDDSDAAQVVRDALVREGVTLVVGRATAVQRDDHSIVVSTDDGETAHGSCLLIAAGRAPNVAGLSLERAGVEVTDRGIPVDDHLRTNVKHIYAAGDVLGREQFSHVAGWQAFQAARNALLPGRARGRPAPIAWVTFTDPEVAQVGLTEAEAMTQHNKHIRVGRWRMNQVDRARCEGSVEGFIKLVTTHDSRLVGATIVGTHAGDVSGELSLAIAHRMKAGEIGGTIHAYPTYATAIQQLAGELATDHWVASSIGRFVRRLMGFRR